MGDIVVIDSSGVANVIKIKIIFVIKLEEIVSVDGQP